MSAIMMTMEAIIDPGDSVVVLHPVWPNINATIGIMGGIARPVSLASTKEGGWKLDLQRVIDACDETTRAIYVNSPGNPTGWMMTREDAEALLEFARKRGLWLLSDEVYSRIVYGRRVAPSFHDVAEPEDRVVALQSFSKAWAMTGWRLGWMVAPPEMLTVMDKIVEYNTSGSPTFLQHAAVTAIKDGEPLIHEIVERCHIGRDLFVQGLARFPRVTVKSPEGSFYAFARVDGCTDSFKLARKIITQAKVGVAPGIAFGDAGEGYLRFCFASSKERLGEALDRMAKTKVLS
jgi:aspartate aminotransferase